MQWRVWNVHWPFSVGLFAKLIRSFRFRCGALGDYLSVQRSCWHYYADRGRFDRIRMVVAPGASTTTSHDWKDDHATHVHVFGDRRRDSLWLRFAAVDERQSRRPRRHHNYWRVFGDYGERCMRRSRLQPEKRPLQGCQPDDVLQTRYHRSVRQPRLHERGHLQLHLRPVVREKCSLSRGDRVFRCVSSQPVPSVII